MKGYHQALIIATAVFSLPLLGSAQSTSNQNSQDTQTTQAPIQGVQEASLMKPARATLVQTLDADKDKDGFTVKAKLEHKVQLTNGTVLPTGTLLIGKVTQDDMQQQGMSKLALRFYQADLKNGQTVPIRATIVGLYGPGALSGAYAENGEAAVPNDWTAKTLQLDQIDAVPGVDLHSKISSQNSGVLVSTKKDNVKLRAGSELQFAIAPANNGNSATSGGE